MSCIASAAEVQTQTWLSSALCVHWHYIEGTNKLHRSACFLKTLASSEVWIVKWSGRLVQDAALRVEVPLGSVVRTKGGV